MPRFIFSNLYCPSNFSKILGHSQANTVPNDLDESSNDSSTVNQTNIVGYTKNKVIASTSNKFLG